MGEGFADFLTGAVFGDDCFGDWFNLARTISGQPCLRRFGYEPPPGTATTVSHYPEVMTDCNFEEHCAGTVWSGALWDIVLALGGGQPTQAARDTVLTIVVESHFYLGSGPNFADGVAAVQAADTNLSGGANLGAINAAFIARGLLQPDGDGDGVPDAQDLCPATPANERPVDANGCSQREVDGDLDGVCDPNVTSTLCFGTDNCPAVTNPGQGDFDGDSLGDACDDDDDGDGVVDNDDPDDDNDGVYDLSELGCGGTTPSARRPERLDTVGVDDDGDTQVDEPLPATSGPYDCDGDGWSGAEETFVYGAQSTANDQDPCGFTGWPADLDGNGFMGGGDLNSFLFPLRGDGSFNKFGHAVPDPQDPALARWDLDSDGSAAGGDLNALNPAVTAPTSAPPMLAGQSAFGRACPWAS